MKQFTREEAIHIYGSHVWETMTDDEIVKLQLFQKKICLPFRIYREALENVLGRRIFTHEFDTSQLLVNEYLSRKPMPTLEEVLAIMGKYKKIIMISQ